MDGFGLVWAVHLVWWSFLHPFPKNGQRKAEKLAYLLRNATTLTSKRNTKVKPHKNLNHHLKKRKTKPIHRRESGNSDLVNKLLPWEMKAGNPEEPRGSSQRNDKEGCHNCYDIKWSLKGTLRSVNYFELSFPYLTLVNDHLFYYPR